MRIHREFIAVGQDEDGSARTSSFPTGLAPGPYTLSSRLSGLGEVRDRLYPLVGVLYSKEWLGPLAPSISRTESLTRHLEDLVFATDCIIGPCRVRPRMRWSVAPKRCFRLVGYSARGPFNFGRVIGAPGGSPLAPRLVS